MDTGRDDEVPVVGGQTAAWEPVGEVPHRPARVLEPDVLPAPRLRRPARRDGLVLDAGGTGIAVNVEDDDRTAGEDSEVGAGPLGPPLLDALPIQARVLEA